MKYWFFSHLLACILLLGIAGTKVWSQDTLKTLLDTVPAQGASSLVIAENVGKKGNAVTNFFRKGYPNPRKALLMSLVVPGTGQIYNRRYWKLPIVYGAIGGSIYFFEYRRSQYKELKDNYLWLVDEDGNTNPVAPYDGFSATSLKYYRDQWRGYVEKAGLLLGVLWFAAAADAYVDAHLKDFDVSDDLSARFEIKPTGYQPNSLGFTTPGIGLFFNISK